MCGRGKPKMGYGSKHGGLQAKFLPSLLLIAVTLSLSAEAKTRHHNWVVEYQFKSPDCFRKLAITIDGQTPGPTIYAEQGDLVVVDVKNGLLTENLAIHWHGIRQNGTPWSDGTAGVTQCPILPGETFTYKFVVDRAGTYLYHAHYELQRSAGLDGMIVVAVPSGVAEPFSYDGDREILLTDWWHRSPQEQATGLSSIPFKFVGEPDSLLIHGKGRFDCSVNDTTDCLVNTAECARHVLSVVSGRTYRLRIGSLASLSALNFEIEGHNMTVVETDGHYVEPFVVKNLYIYSGETYSVLVTADQDSTRNYWAAINVVGRKPDTPTGLAIFGYQYSNNTKREPPTRPPVGPLWNDTAPRLRQNKLIRARKGYVVPPPQTTDRRIILLNTQNKVDGHTKWAVNNVSFNLPQIPYLFSLKKNLQHAFDQSPAPETYDYKNYDIGIVQENPNATTTDSIYRLAFNSTVDVILQNANMLDPNKSETHPWHLHGHDFWVLGYGQGKYDPARDWNEYNLVDPIMKNSVPLHPYGWTAIRFQANNPGAWAFHCHIESHFFMGMRVVFEEAIERVGPIPPFVMGCVPFKHRA